MNGLLKAVTCSGIVAFAGMTVAEVSAATHSFTAAWSSGTVVGQVAAWCNYIVPDERPLTVPRTFVVGNDVPNGTEIFSWGYGEAFSDFIVLCTSSGISGGGADIDGYLDSRILMSYDTGGYIPLSDSGLGLKLWFRYNTSPGFNYTGCGGVTVQCEYYDTSYYSPSYTQKVPVGTEVDGTLAGYTSQGVTQAMRKYRFNFSPVNYIFPTHTGSVSVRMSLVKIGTIQYNGALTAKSPAIAMRNTIRQNTNTATLTGFLDGSGITIAPPACQLKTTDYTLPMGRWAADVINYTGAPAYGAQVPVNLSLECTGKVNHVRFRFEDTGTSLSSNKNISLYDTAGGSKIEGLEIEMLYNGSKVNVDNTTITDTGSHGAFVSLTPAFDSFGTAAFHARYVQNAAVTRSGANYTGPVTGKVNMYVTYD
uniref:fimbrial protein n=1 Tax=Klebsiella sp. TaxID=576 RepID=UPI0025873AC5|nr:fimbrial protein [Klebsiella sp.]